MNPRFGSNKIPGVNKHSYTLFMVVFSPFGPSRWMSIAIARDRLGKGQMLCQKKVYTIYGTCV